MAGLSNLARFMLCSSDRNEPAVVFGVNMSF
jgi:hypothetical protein